MFALTFSQSYHFSENTENRFALFCLCNMNLTEAKIEKEAAQCAKTLRTQAVKNEPQITEDLQTIASEVSAEMVGLEHRFKSAESLTRKITEESAKSAKSLIDFGYSVDEAIEKSTKRRAERNNDALRYTFVFPLEKYVFGFRQTVEKLRQTGYEIPKNKIWNAWKNIGTLFDKGYRGINITIISSRKQIFELQFHTGASYELKTETHLLYEESRQNRTSQERKIEIAEIVIRLAEKVKTPKGVKKL